MLADDVGSGPIYQVPVVYEFRVLQVEVENRLAFFPLVLRDQDLERGGPVAVAVLALAGLKVPGQIARRSGSSLAASSFLTPS
jgi:hypothetical protein